jgi:hypothetical protein
MPVTNGHVEDLKFIRIWGMGIILRAVSFWKPHSILSSESKRETEAGRVHSVPQILFLVVGFRFGM